MSGVTPVATYGQTNFASQTGTQYKTQIDSNSIVAQRVVDCFAPRQSNTPAMTVTLDAGYIFKGTTLTEVGAQTTGTITAPVGNPRIDRVVIDRFTGTVSVITGTPAASPAAPAVTSGKVPICQVLIQTSSTSITNSMITDERALYALGRGLAAEEGIGQWLKDDGAGNLTLDVNATLKDNGSGKLTTGLFTESTLSSATTTDLGTAASNIVSITGTTAITSFGSSASAVNPLYFIRFTGALALTHNATSLILPGGANITTAAGDAAVAKYEGSGNWRVVQYTPANGRSISAFTSTVPGLVPASGGGTANFLRADGTFAQPAAGALVYLGTFIASNSATLDLTSVITSTYDDYLIVLNNLLPATTSENLLFRTSEDNGSSYTSTAGAYRWAYSRNGDDSTTSNQGDATDPSITLADVISNAASNAGVNGTIHLYAVNGTSSNKKITTNLTYFHSTGNAHQIVAGCGIRSGTAAINAVRLLMSSGNLTSGTAKIYGIAKA